MNHQQLAKIIQTGLGVVLKQVEMLKERSDAGMLLDCREGRLLTDYLQAAVVVQRGELERAKLEESDVQRMTTEELEAIVLPAIQAKRLAK